MGSAKHDGLSGQLRVQVSQYTVPFALLCSHTLESRMWVNVGQWATSRDLDTTWGGGAQVWGRTEGISVPVNESHRTCIELTSGSVLPQELQTAQPMTSKWSNMAKRLSWIPSKAKSL
jgi:hypothetical protein